MRIGKLFVLLAVGLAGTVGVASAQEKPIKVGIVDIARAFNDQKETADFQAKAEADGKILQGNGEDKDKDIKALQASLRDMKPDTPQYEDTKKKIITKLVEFKAWQEIVSQDLQRMQKQQIKATFDKIQGAVRTVADKKGLDLVLAESNPQIPTNLDQLNVDQLKAAIQQRNVLFKGPASLDITADVVLELNKAYDAEKKK